MEETRMAHTYVKTSNDKIYDLEYANLNDLKHERIVQQTNVLEDFLDEFIVCVNGRKFLVDLDFDIGARKYLYRVLDHDEWVIFNGSVHIFGATWNGLDLVTVAELKEDGEWEVL